MSNGTKELYVDEKLIASGTQEEVLLIMNLIIERESMKEVAEDVVQVVRCVDCAVPHNRWTGCPKLNGLVTPPDFYCSYGERRKECKECPEN